MDGDNRPGYEATIPRVCSCQPQQSCHNVPGWESSRPTSKGGKRVVTASATTRKIPISSIKIAVSSSSGSRVDGRHRGERNELGNCAAPATLHHMDLSLSNNARSWPDPTTSTQSPSDPAPGLFRARRGTNVQRSKKDDDGAGLLPGHDIHYSGSPVRIHIRCVIPRDLITISLRIKGHLFVLPFFDPVNSQFEPRTGISGLFISLSAGTCN